jgi:bacterioferritin-associated ferredoxin
LYVCVCNAVTDKEIREHVRGGACTLADLAGCAGVGAGCGRCRDVALEVLREAREGSDRTASRQLHCAAPA